MLCSRSVVKLPREVVDVVRGGRDDGVNSIDEKNKRSRHISTIDPLICVHGRETGC